MGNLTWIYKRSFKSSKTFLSREGVILSHCPRRMLGIRLSCNLKTIPLFKTFLINRKKNNKLYKSRYLTCLTQQVTK